MLKIYTAHRGGLQQQPPGEMRIPPEAVWLDLSEPSFEETHTVESFLGIEVPSREDMQEIEISSRLYQEDGAVFLTAIVLAKSDTEAPELSPITFIITGDRLVTLRYAEPRPFPAFSLRAQRPASGYNRGPVVLLGLLEAVVDRAADILERIGADVDAISKDIFQQGTGANRGSDFQSVLSKVGRKGDLCSKARESLVSIGRIATFLMQAAMDNNWAPEIRARFKTLGRDVHSLTDHASFLASKIAFLMEATLGMIGIEQNAIIKIFSVAAVVFLPPTLIASIYGMNYQHMPELEWSLGYPWALGLMLISAFLPYWYFKRKGWL